VELKMSASLGCVSFPTNEKSSDLPKVWLELSGLIGCARMHDVRILIPIKLSMPVPHLPLRIAPLWTGTMATNSAELFMETESEPEAGTIVLESDAPTSFKPQAAAASAYEDAISSSLATIVRTSLSADFQLRCMQILGTDSMADLDRILLQITRSAFTNRAQ
jgi:hypothetical protein